MHYKPTTVSDVIDMEYNEIIEALAAIEHDQWMDWSKSIAQTEELSTDRIERWSKLWVPYEELDDNVKEQDRIYARQVYIILDKALTDQTKYILDTYCK